MRVIAGAAKGRRLKVPQSKDIRPITDMIKEALFNTLGQYLQDKSFLDLFAGSGAVGIEALSRGAKNVIFVEKEAKAVEIIHYNLRHCRLEDRARVIKGDAFKVIGRLADRGERFDYIYVDPPFSRPEYYSRLPGRLPELMRGNSLLIIRAPKGVVLSFDYRYLSKWKEAVYGDSILYYYLWNESLFRENKSFDKDDLQDGGGLKGGDRFYT